MKRYVFAIVHSSYIIRKGLKNILLDLVPTALVEELENESVALSQLSRMNADIIVIDKEYISPEIITSNADIILLNTIDEENTLNVFWQKQKIIHFLEPLFSEMKKKESTNDLSEREKEIVRNVALGLTNQEIGDALFISTHTVITHRKNIVKKLGIKTVSGLTVYAIFNNLVDPNEVKG